MLFKLQLILFACGQFQWPRRDPTHYAFQVATDTIRSAFSANDTVIFEFTGKGFKYQREQILLEGFGVFSTQIDSMGLNFSVYILLFFVRGLGITHISY